MRLSPSMHSTHHHAPPIGRLSLTARASVSTPLDSPRCPSPQVEPKLFFANERTFIHWLNMAVTISSLGAAVLAFSPEDTFAEVRNGISVR